MEEFLVNKNQDPTKNIEEGPKKTINLEAIKNDRGLLEFLYDKFTTLLKKKIWSKEEEKFSYGGYEEADFETITFYICYFTGIDVGDTEPVYVKPLVVEYLGLLLKNPAEADSYLGQQMGGDVGTEIQEVQKKLSRGFKLSDIIQGAPDLITENIIGRPESPSFIPRITAKVGDIGYVQKEDLKKIAEVVRGKTVVDLAAGQAIDAPRIFKNLGARNYVAVEPFNTFETLYYIRTSVEKNNFDKIHISKTDMLTFLQKLPDNSKDLVFLISGVDQWILGGFGVSAEVIENSNKYVAAVFSELKRVMEDDCRLLTYASFYPKDVEGFTQELKTEAGEGPVYMYKVNK